MKYTEIQGWFSEEELYARIVAEAPRFGTLVEVGCWMGKSTCFMGQQIQESGKKLTLFAVDTWRGSPDEPELVAEVARHGGSIFDAFWGNMRAAGVDDLIIPVKASSLDAAHGFADAIAVSGAALLEFVFIDADHRYESVKADIAAWLPLVKPGGTLAGHDWNTYGDVQRAVREAFGDNFTVECNSWVHRVK